MFSLLRTPEIQVYVIIRALNQCIAYRTTQDTKSDGRCGAAIDPVVQLEVPPDLDIPLSLIGF